MEQFAELMSNPYMVSLVGILVILILGALLRTIANRYADSKVALIMLSVEKRLSTWAKDQASNGSDKKKQAVQLLAEYLYPILPVWMKVFVTKDFLIAKIEKLYDEMLDYLDDWKLNDSIYNTPEEDTGTPEK